MSGLEFTEDAARRLEHLYLTKDVVEQRAETVRLLAPLSGEHVLDVGCGPGFLCESISSLVGSDGAVVGIDISGDLIELCRRRSPPRWLSYAVGDATQLAQPATSFDAVVCTQVVEYIQDVSRALTEAFRVLKEGGRAVFVATDWDSVIWFSDLPDRMALVLKSWETHCAHPRLPRSLGARLVSAGFRVDEAVVFPILNLQWVDTAYSTGLAGFIRDFVGRKNELPAEELSQWYDELARLNETGRYFFSSNRYIFLASKPAR
ncbi:methyltransferase domain-containing protein [Bradyrhizobium yuanmingense]|uniref:methyltransferase domain-containing protein n=1 Tax=Bradyrhizobium yuanmingense TaxID=108015 RepID=UPI0023B95799|nr:methyltransferase domain-containing protein [Bradyrhizobium yuanmingense]MDF0495139.1 methyltransferase domain-containing protein [Bradyrhizobium yuanmingense]MDF0580973.1 methyltransferase domain-containing protein [Bradyrhizobium yuanmingense]